MDVPEDVQLGLDAPELGEEAGAAEVEVEVVARRRVGDENVCFRRDTVRPGVVVAIVLEPVPG